MKHIAPHRWADAFAGKLPDAEISAMDRHAQSCRSCARARDRVTRASQSYPVLRVAPPPDVAWDSVRARIHWSVSTEKRARERASRRPSFALLAIAAGGAVAVFAGGPMRMPAAPAPAAVAVAPRAVPAESAVAPVVGLVSRLTGEVMFDGTRPVDAFAQPIGAGSVIATADGRVDVQFGEASAFALAPHSTLELRKFDERSIELVVEGTVDVEVAPRAQGQRFVVVAGDREVEVRGTQFRVTHDKAGVEVACRHGLVAVRDHGAAVAGHAGEVDVASARKVALAAGVAASDARAVALSTDELAQLADATPVTAPAWTGADALLHGSSPLEIATPGHRDVRVDGVEVGRAPLKLRVMPGRHTVEAADRAGRFHRAGWVDVSPAHAARLEVDPIEAPAPSGGIAARKKELHAGVDKGRLARCTRSIVMAGVTDSYVQIEIAVDASGAVGFLNVIDTDLPSSTSSCVREVLADVQFGAGAPATWRERIDLR